MGGQGADPVGGRVAERFRILLDIPAVYKGRQEAEDRTLIDAESLRYIEKTEGRFLKDQIFKY